MKIPLRHQEYHNSEDYAFRFAVESRAEDFANRHACFRTGLQLPDRRPPGNYRGPALLTRTQMPLGRMVGENEAAGATDASRDMILERCAGIGISYPAPWKRIRQRLAANKRRRKLHSIPIACRVRRNRQPLPSSLLIANVSARAFRLAPAFSAEASPFKASGFPETSRFSIDPAYPGRPQRIRSRASSNQISFPPRQSALPIRCPPPSTC